MTFQEILDGIAKHRANRATVSDPEIQRKFEEIEWALMALAEALRDREQELSAVAPHERAGHGVDALDKLAYGDHEVDDAFDEYEKRE